MSLILNIDTSSGISYVFLADNEKILATAQNDVPKNHASFIEPAIQGLFKATGLSIKEIDAVAVVSGPGSYTGLRVGLATAKGLCYALNRPLIFLNTLELLAAAAIEEVTEIYGQQPENSVIPANQQHHLPGKQPALNDQSPVINFFCPMIDARRMEVFTALYDSCLNLVEKPQALILTEASFESYLEKGRILFSGDGSTKFKEVCRHENALFSTVNYTVKQISIASKELFSKNRFVDIAYSEPFYLKEFFSNFKKI